MRNDRRIDKGDKVRVYFTASTELELKGVVVSAPQEGRKEWIIEDTRTGLIIYVGSYETMYLESKGKQQGVQ